MLQYNYLWLEILIPYLYNAIRVYSTEYIRLKESTANETQQLMSDYDCGFSSHEAHRVSQAHSFKSTKLHSILVKIPVRVKPDVLQKLWAET